MKKKIRISSMPYQKAKCEHGFTLVEILVVVLIIGILGAILVKTINVRGLQRKSRDAVRVADLRKIQTSLELYFADNRAYPLCQGSGDPCLDILHTDGYLNPIPVDPAISVIGVDYVYISNERTYTLAAQMEVASSASASPCTSTVPGIIAANCYQVFAPNN